MIIIINNNNNNNNTPVGKKKKNETRDRLVRASKTTRRDYSTLTRELLPLTPGAFGATPRKWR